MKNLKQLLKKQNKSSKLQKMFLLKPKLNWKKLKTLLNPLLVMMLIMIPVLSYSQSKSKYPKQTIINGDSVVILSLQQAIDMNQSFLKIQAQIDSINAVADTLQTTVLIQNSETTNLQQKLESSTNRLSKYYVRKNRLEVMGEVMITVSAFALWAIVTNILNTK